MATARVPGKGSGADDKTSDGAADAENKDVGLVHPLSELSGSEEGALDIDEKNPFRDPIAAQHWREVYDASQYECRHVYDPSLTWTEEEEKKLIRKLDWRVCLWAVCSLQTARVKAFLTRCGSVSCSSVSRSIAGTLLRLFQTTCSMTWD